MAAGIASNTATVFISSNNAVVTIASNTATVFISSNVAVATVKST